MDLPQTRYARNGDLNIAYQSFGDGPVTLVYAQGWLSNVEYMWESPEYARFLNRLGQCARVIVFDKRGTGMSDREVSFSTIEERADDICAVLDAEGVDDCVVFGVSEGGNMVGLFAAMYPERTRALILYGCSARAQWAPDYPWGQRREEFELEMQDLMSNWGKPFNLRQAAPSMASDPVASRWFAAYLRYSASPRSAEMYSRVNFEIDMRDVLPSIQSPCLILHRREDHWTQTAEAEYLAKRISDSRLVVLPGEDHLPWYGNQNDILSEIEDFVIGDRNPRRSERVLMTLLMTDIVESTGHLEQKGDAEWATILEQFSQRTLRRVEAFGGAVHGDTGDGHLASFAGPSRALECARALKRDAEALGFRIRSGVHTGECEKGETGLRGLAVHTVARLCSQAAENQTLATSTVHDLSAGAPFDFQGLGEVTFKGISQPVRIFAVS